MTTSVGFLSNTMELTKWLLLWELKMCRRRKPMQEKDDFKVGERVKINPEAKDSKEQCGGNHQEDY